MQNISLVPHFSNSIWGFSLSITCEKPNIKWKTTPLSTVTSKPSHPPLKGGNGGEYEEELFTNIARMLVFTPLFQPFKNFRVMMQFGYEPVNPYPVKGKSLMDYLMGRPDSTSLYLPGIAGYSRGVIQAHGWGCLVAGLGPSLVGMIIDTVIETRWSRQIDHLLTEKLGFELQNRPTGFDLKRVAYSALKANIIQTISLLHSYPLSVCGNLSILRCVKGEPSVWIWRLFGEVWEEAGLGGFYSGLLAMLLYQYLNVWTEELLVEGLIFLMDKMNQPLDRNTGVDITLAHLIVTSFTYPFFLISNIMMVNKCLVGKRNKFEELPVFPSWVDCLKHLYRVGIWFRGSSVLQRRFLSLV